MSINAKQKISFIIQDNTSLSKDFQKNISYNIKQNNLRNLTEIKELNNFSRREEKTSKCFSKFKIPILTQREREYDKNLKRIKSNLMDKFDNYSLLNTSVNESNDKNNKEKSISKNLKRERSRYNLKQYSPSIINSKKLSHLKIENSEYFRKLKNNNDYTYNKEGLFKSLNENLNKNEKKNFEDIIKNNQIVKLQIISMRKDEKKDEKENIDDEVYLDIENSDSKNKLRKKRFEKKILIDKNNIFSIESDFPNNNHYKNSKESNAKLSNNKHFGVNNYQSINNSNAAINGSNRENKFSCNSTCIKIDNGKSIHSNTSKYINNKKFIFNNKNDRVNKSGDNTQARFSELRNKIEANLNLIEKNDFENNLNKRINFDQEENKITYNQNIQKNKPNKHKRINSISDISLHEDKTAAEEENKEFLSNIQENYKEFIKENFEIREVINVDNKEVDIDMCNNEDLSFSTNNFEEITNENLYNENLIDRSNNDLNFKSKNKIRKNSFLEIIHEKNEGDHKRNPSISIMDLTFNECHSINPIRINENNNLTTIDDYHNYNVNCDLTNNNNNEIEKNNILESGSLSRKFSEMKKTISNNLNNIHNMNSNCNYYSNYKNIILNNNQSEKLFTSSYINSMESLKNIKESFKILSNNINANNEAILKNSANFLDFSSEKDVLNHKRNDLNSDYFRSLQNSSINNINNNAYNQFSIRYNANIINSNLISHNPKTPDIINVNINQQNKNNICNPYLTQYNHNNANNYNDNYGRFMPCSTIYNSNNFNLKFNNLNLNSIQQNYNNFNNQLNSNYNHSCNNKTNNIDTKSINNPNNSNNVYSLSEQFKNFTNQLSKINLLEYNNFNMINNNDSANDHIYENNAINIESNKLSNNNMLQDQINLVTLTFNSINNKNINNFTKSFHNINTSNFFSKIKLLENSFNNNDLEIENNKLSIADKLIFFITEQYRDLLSVFLNIDYGKEIIKDFQNQNFELPPILLNHLITERMRSKMVDWMIEVTENYRCDQTSYFLAVNLMDRFFCSYNDILKPEDLHIIGISCMFIASKYHDIFPIKLNSASEKVSHGKISKEEIKCFEEKILKTLNYDITFPTLFDFINFFVHEIFNVFENNFNVKNEILKDYVREFSENQNKICFKGKENTNKILLDKNYYENFTKVKDFDLKFLSVLKKILLYLSKMNCYDVSLNVIKPSLLAGSTLLLGVKITEQILQTNYINQYLLEKIISLSLSDINEICYICEKILHNCKNFEKIYPGLENLKKFYFDIFN